MARIVVRIPNWLGDAVMAAAALREYRRMRPTDEITLFGYPYLFPVFHNSPDSYSFIPFDRKANRSSWAGFAQIASRLRKERFDAGYLMPNSFSSAWLFWAGGIINRIGFRGHWRRALLTRTLSLPAAARHQAQRYAYLLTETIPKDLRPEIYVAPEEQERSEQALKNLGLQDAPLIGVAFGSSTGAANLWLPQRYAETIRLCCAKWGAKTILFGTEKEAATAQTIVSQTRGECINLVGKTNLRELFAFVRQCRALLSIDSGVMHVGAAVGTPVIALFGPSDPMQTGPLGNGHYIVQREMDCIPCMERNCPLGHHACMEEIQVEDVIMGIEKLLETNP
ncbi:MAG: lipopolysaccharide heptosyltransferase II [Candidatus Omnitrophota bacterium]